jgi:hypothetical protein
MARNQISKTVRERVADHKLRRADQGAVAVISEILNTCKGMAGILGTLTGTDAHEEACAEHMSSMAWAIHDEIEIALLVLEGLRKEEANRTPRPPQLSLVEADQTSKGIPNECGESA